MNILVMESSTTSAKVMIYNSTENSLKVAEKPYLDQKTEEGLQDPEAVYMQTLNLAKQICSGSKVDLIALSGTWHSLILCDRDMKPISPSFLWSYTGPNDLCSILRKDSFYTQNFYEKTGCTVYSMYPFFKLKYLSVQGIDISDSYIMGQGSYNYFRLTKVRSVMDSMASGSGLFNINELRYDQALLDELGLRADQLPALNKWSVTNPLSFEAAGILKLQAGIPVINAGPDGALNQVGSNALEEGIMTLSVGTSAALRMSVEKPMLSSDKSTWCYLSPKRWLSGAATSGACNCVDWIKSLMFPAGTAYAECEQEERENFCKAPIFLPFLYGERSPGWNDKRQAAFFNVLPNHNKYDYYYSVQEGVLFNILQCYKKLCALNGIPKKIVISGGILNSSRWIQMCADIINSELTVENAKHSSMVGALILALELANIDLNQLAVYREEKKKIYPQLKMDDFYKERMKLYSKYYESGTEYGSD